MQAEVPRQLNCVNSEYDIQQKSSRTLLVDALANLCWLAQLITWLPRASAVACGQMLCACNPLGRVVTTLDILTKK